jgi:hypothetical protein
MPHVTFIHGIANKPKEDELRRIWVRALEEAAEPLSLSNEGVTSSMVYWADLMYAAPITDTSNFEGVLENTAAAIDGGGDAPMPVPANAEEARFIEGMREKLTRLDDRQLADPATPAVPPAATGTLERIPLPWFIKKPMMNAFLRDVHHYLFNVKFAPPGGTPVLIQDTIRRRFVDQVAKPASAGRHIVVSHSMGTVIAYDCLKRVPECAKVDGLITIGCPLGLDEVQDKLQPGWSRAEGYPADRVADRWVNLFDRLDPVCGFDPQLANDFRLKGAERVQDIVVENDGVWRHSGTKYLRQPKFCATLRSMLGL